VGRDGGSLVFMKTTTLSLLCLLLAGCDRSLELGDGSRSGLDTCTSKVCSLWCPQGYVVDERGCETCTCLPPADAGVADAGATCGPTFCSLACPNGFLRDDAGCERCVCAPGIDGGGDAGVVDAGVVDAGAQDAGAPDTGAVDAGSCTTDCQMPCPNGYLRAPNGCEICACAPAPDAGCSGPPFCTLPCQFGFKRNAQGCELCACSPPPMSTCAPPPCSLVCSRGYNSDSARCLLCECSN
jgi:hypothetical protein